MGIYERQSFIRDLYHISHEIVEIPIYSKDSQTSDYGRGFYFTETLELAKEWV